MSSVIDATQNKFNELWKEFRGLHDKQAFFCYKLDEPLYEISSEAIPAEEIVEDFRRYISQLETIFQERFLEFESILMDIKKTSDKLGIVPAADLHFILRDDIETKVDPKTMKRLQETKERYHKKLDEHKKVIRERYQKLKNEWRTSEKYEKLIYQLFKDWTMVMHTYGAFELQMASHNQRRRTAHDVRKERRERRDIVQTLIKFEEEIQQIVPAYEEHMHHPFLVNGSMNIVEAMPSYREKISKNHCHPSVVMQDLLNTAAILSQPQPHMKTAAAIIGTPPILPFPIVEPEKNKKSEKNSRKAEKSNKDNKRTNCTKYTCPHSDCGTWAMSVIAACANSELETEAITEQNLDERKPKNSTKPSLPIVVDLRNTNRTIINH